MVKKKTGKRKKENRDFEEEVEKKVSKKEQVKSENKILKGFLILIGLVIFGIVFTIVGYNAVNSFEYNGVEFDVAKFCDSKPCLITYHTSIPVLHQGEVVPYNFFLRNDPRELKSVPFNGELKMADTLVINSTQSFNCEGKGIIAVKNLATLYEVAGISVIQDAEAECSANGDYIFLRLIEGEETKVQQTGLACYDVHINNCEILEGTERFMVETFVELNKLL